MVPNFNKASFLAETIDSVLAQGDLAETIFVDDASTDDSLRYLEAAALHHRNIRLIRAPSRIGGSACRNLGLASAKGRFVIFLDSDDLLARDCCQMRLEAAATRPECDLWVFPMELFRNRPEEPEGTWIPEPGDHLRHFLSHRLDWSVMQPLWRSSFLREIGGFDESFPRLQDPEIHTKALLRNARVAVFPNAVPDCKYRIAEERHTSDATELARQLVEGATRYYRVFAEQVNRDMLPLLTGNLLACQGMLLHWWRSKRLDAAEVDRLHGVVVAECRLAAHRGVLRATFGIQRGSPVHLPGLRLLTKRLLGLP